MDETIEHDNIEFEKEFSSFCTKYYSHYRNSIKSYYSLNEETGIQCKELSSEELTFQDTLKFFLVFSLEFVKKIFPIAVIFLIFVMIAVTNILFISHSKYSQGDLLYSIILGNSIFNIFGNCICVGVNSALDTLCTNAFGAKIYSLMGCYLNRTIIIVSCIYLVMLIPFLNLTSILIAFGHRAEVASLAGEYVRGSLIGIIFFYYGDACRRFIMSQGILITPIFAVLITSLLHPIWVYFFYIYLDLKAMGQGLANSVSNIIIFILMFSIMKKYSVQGSVHKFDRESFTGFREYFKIAVPALIMNCLDAWNGQIVNFCVGFLNDPVQEKGFTLLNSFSLILFMFPFGLSMSSSIIVGKYVGKYSPLKAQIASRMILTFVYFFAFVMAIIILSLRSYIPYIFSKDVEIVSLLQKLICFLIFYIFIDYLTATYSGIYRGCGRQKISALAIFLSFYMISLPLVYLLAFKFKMGVYGIWISFCIGNLTLFICYSLIHKFKTDFNTICHETKNRIEKDKEMIKISLP